ncbi:MAG: hypothetical protein JXN63_06335 [Candidatus Delongbacteria bacterium]|nr:hypothetical protein [Candidatus Delongbacteria bacterium]
MRKLIIILIIAAAPVFQYLTAGVDEVLSFMSKKNVEGYIKPLVTSLGVGLNSGMYHNAEVSEKISGGFSMRALIIFIPEDQKSFTPYLPAGYTSGSTSTVYGGDPGYAYGTGGFVSYPGGFEVDNLPMGFPQMTLAWKGTELSAKFIPTQKIGTEREEFYFYSFAIKHEVTRYFKKLPFDGAVQFGIGKMKFSDQLDFDNFVINLIASRKFGLFTIYGGTGFQSTRVDANYSITGDPDNADPELREAKDVSLTIKGDNSLGITAGTSLRLGFFVLNADYTYNSQSVISTGMSFEF